MIGLVIANALNASAVVFENVYEVDHKFAKWVDKECEGISNEVKKWFKKLAVRFLHSFHIPSLKLIFTLWTYAEGGEDP